MEQDRPIEPLMWERLKGTYGRITVAWEADEVLVIYFLPQEWYVI